MFEVLFEIGAEFVLQILVEILIEFGFHALAEPLQRKPKPSVAAIGYLLFGGLLGALSLIPFSQHFTSSVTWRLVNLVVTPLMAGLTMMMIGRLRSQNNQDILRIDKFVYGFLFALSFALVRFFFAH